MSEPGGTLPFTVTTSGGEILEFAFPLHPHTAQPEQVGVLLEGLLDKLTDAIETAGDISDGDVIQALTLAIAVRLAVAGLTGESSRALLEDLLARALRGLDGGQRASGPGRRH